MCVCVCVCVYVYIYILFLRNVEMNKCLHIRKLNSLKSAFGMRILTYSLVDLKCIFFSRCPLQRTKCVIKLDSFLYPVIHS